MYLQNGTQGGGALIGKRSVVCSLSTRHPNGNLVNPFIKFLFACRLDGTCRHIAIALLDLERTAHINDLRSCTSGQCQWIRCAKPNTN